MGNIFGISILARQIFHYVNDIEVVLNLLREKLSSNGLFYVGQFVVCDNDSDKWHKNLIQKISKNRKRSFTFDGFQKAFESNGFRIIECCTEDYEENIKDFYTRRTNEELEYNNFYKSVKNSLNENITEKMHIKVMDNNIFFTVQFCHLLLERYYYLIIVKIKCSRGHHGFHKPFPQINVIPCSEKACPSSFISSFYHSNVFSWHFIRKHKKFLTFVGHK